MTAKRVFKVGTFCHTKLDAKVGISKIQAYSLWYNPVWDKCIEYEVTASSGREARRKASELRLAHEHKVRGTA